MQVKGVMPKRLAYPQRTPTGRAVGTYAHGITMNTQSKFFIPLGSFVYSALFLLLIFIDFCEWMDSSFYGIVCCQKGG